LQAYAFFILTLNPGYQLGQRYFGNTDRQYEPVTALFIDKWQ
jgi:hypothetical protein